jgi:hypothetical protein
MRKINSVLVLLFFGFSVLMASCAHIKKNGENNSVVVNLDLSRDDEGIAVTAHIVPGALFSGNFSFLLGQSMNIESVYTADSECEYEIVGVDDPFRQINKISVHVPNKSAEIRVRYSGKPEGFHTFNNDVVFAVNIYSAWYPDEISIGKTDIKVKFYDTYYTHVVNAIYHKTEQAWEYHPRDFDCNILAYKDPQVLRNDFVDLLYVSDDGGLANAYYEAYVKAADFCKDLFGTNRLSKGTLAILPDGNAYSGYARESLIVLGGFTNDLSYAQHLLAHEIAHNWCKDADAFTWEDWLNETTAEWTALLFQLNEGNMEEFNALIENTMQGYADLPPIKTNDGSRPNGVPVKGTILFYNIYRQYGYETIAKMLQLFDALAAKTTENFVASIRSGLSPDIARMIEHGVEE